MMNRVAQIAKVDRPQMGEQIPLLVFRAFRHFSAQYVEDLMGRGAAVAFQNGGRELGREVGPMLLKPDLGAYLGAVVEWVRDAKLGLLRAVSVSDQRLVLALDECITCAGMENLGKRICHFEVGFVAGVVETFVKRKVRASETKCNANGEETCEVTVDF
jgi:predicted hydrocarbon binding protein